MTEPYKPTITWVTEADIPPRLGGGQATSRYDELIEAVRANEGKVAFFDRVPYGANKEENTKAQRLCSNLSSGVISRSERTGRRVSVIRRAVQDDNGTRWYNLYAFVLPEEQATG